jgi:molybdopterin-biosynthesis enzyme MoeA-like protein
MTPRFGLFVIGDEILSGKRTDRHFGHVIGLLSARGLTLSWAQYLPDDRRALVDALRLSFGGDDAVFSCGGIGSTPDDHTRQAAAIALGVDLVLHPEAASEIALRCAQLGQPDMTTPENRQRLTMGEFPRGARIIANPYNRIPGFAVARHYFVPGFPVMAWPMIEAILDTEFREHFHSRPTAERSLLLYETPESAIAPLMMQVEARFPGVKTFSLPSIGDGSDGRPARRHIELGVKGPPAAVEPAFEFVRDALTAMAAPFDAG